MTTHVASPHLIDLYRTLLARGAVDYPRFQGATEALQRFFTAPPIAPITVPSPPSTKMPTPERDDERHMSGESLERQEMPTTKASEMSWYARLKQGLRKTHAQLGTQLNKLLGSDRQIDSDFLESLETLLITADVGVQATDRIIGNVTAKIERTDDQKSTLIRTTLEQELVDILHKVDTPLDVSGKNPFVILVVGVNGVGKTTTIGKLAKYYQSNGLSVMLAAGDTFRAAAVEQLQVWGQRNDVQVVAQHTGADSASVIFDAVQSAQAKNVDIVIADTAGRLHNKSNLMTELAKVKRVMQKLDPSAPHETLLVLDANTGQNATNQAKQFHESVGLSGIALTKLDGTAKGGIIFALSETLSLPVRFIGVGEGIDDLRPFEAKEFVDALLSS